MGRRGFLSLLALALGTPAAFVLALLLAQAQFAGPSGALASLFDPDLRHAVALSLGTATLSAVLAQVVAIPAAYGLARLRFPGKGVVDLLLDVPVVLSPVAVGISLLLVLRSAPGQWVEEHLLRFIFEVPGIVLAQCTVATALSIRVLKATFQDVDVRFEQVARFLGCTPWSAFWRVSLPLARRGIVASSILAWARSIGEFGATVTLAGAVAGKTETIPVAVYLRLAAVDLTGAVSLMLVLSAVSLAVLAAVRLLGGAR